MYKKRALVLGGYLSLLALAACGPKVIDDSDLVSIDYKYTFSDGTLADQGSMEITIGEAGNFEWIESIVRGAEKGDEFVGTMDGKEIYAGEYDSNKVQSYPNIILTEVMGIENPAVGTEVEVSSIGDGVITSVDKNDEGYDEYVVNFNDPKTYSELSYLIKVTNIEKN